MNRNLNANDVFTTLTYSRNQSPRDTWLRVNSDTNRFLQRVSRKIGDVEYLRVFEHHKDNYPHIHIHLRFRPEKVIRERDIYLYDVYFRRLKQAWVHGLSDHQCPKYSHHFPVAYILKYLGKSTSSSRLWAQILNGKIEPQVNDLGYPIKAQAGKNIWKLISVPIPRECNLLRSRFKWKRIKLMSYSRGYIATFNSK